MFFMSNECFVNKSLNVVYKLIIPPGEKVMDGK